MPCHGTCYFPAFRERDWSTQRVSAWASTQCIEQTQITAHSLVNKLCVPPLWNFCSKSKLLHFQMCLQSKPMLLFKNWLKIVFSMTGTVWVCFFFSLSYLDGLFSETKQWTFLWNFHTACCFPMSWEIAQCSNVGCLCIGLGALCSESGEFMSPGACWALGRRKEC